MILKLFGTFNCEGQDGCESLMTGRKIHCLFFWGLRE